MTNVQLSADAIRVEGQPKILLCASLFYFRIPRENWEERMRQLRMCGYNCIDVYFPWNFHELRPGEWRFDDMHDADAFLTLAARHGLYVIARPGPYICSEWDGGALPSWLDRSALDLRQDDGAYLAQLNRWLEKILPIIAAHEAGRGGSVVAVQLENEMDFFGCKAPEAYMAKLRETARRCGVTVPLTACAGECDVQGAGGTAEGVHPTFNAYCADDFPHLETQLTHMRRLAAELDTPLMITETNRLHALLKRELISGARLISPYNQVGGTDVDMTNGISNWAADVHRPVALMASDYDFNSMITVDGRLRAEALKARLMGSLIESLGAHLATGEPCEAPVSPVCDFPTAQALREDGRDEPCYPSMKMDCGWLIGVTNLSTQDGWMRLPTAQGEAKCRVGAYETALLPWRLSLAPWGVDAAIDWSEAEIVSIERAQDGLRLTLTGGVDARVCIGGHVASGADWTQLGRVGVRILPEAEAARQCALPALDASVPSVISTREVRRVSAQPFNVRKAARPLGEGVRTMEAAGVYRGDVFYETELADDAPLLLLDTADFLWANNEGGCTARFGDGSGVLLDGHAGKWSLRVQSWGHVNFDDVRQPSLKMGSPKGVSRIIRVLEQQDITDLWLIYPDAKYETQGRAALRQTDRIMATTINTWSYPASPMSADFVRTVYLRGDCDSFLLHIEQGGAQVSAWIDGEPAGSLRANDPWLALSCRGKAGRSVELRLRVTRRFSHESLGAVTLVSGQAVSGVRMAGVSVEDWQALAPQGAYQAAELPLAVAPGEEQMLADVLPEGEPKARMLVLEGRGVEATLIAHGHVCGRVQLATDGYPEVRGGSSRRVYLPREWADDSVLLHVCGIGTGGALTALRWEEIAE